MGCLCGTLFIHSFKPIYLNPEKPFNFNFSTENDSSFYIPVRYSSISTQLNLILNTDPETWISYKAFLQEAKEYLHQTLNSIDNYLFQEDQTLESGSFLMSSTANPQDLNRESPRLERKNSNGLDYYERFRLKTFQLEINKLIFLGDNNPENLGLMDPFIEITIGNETQKEIFTSKTLLTKEKQNFVWNELTRFPFAKNIERVDLIKSQFTISIYFRKKESGQKELLGETYCFSFSELTHQMLVEKHIKIRNPMDKKKGSFFAILLFRCQVIYDYFRLLNYWKKEIEVKLEIIQRIFQKITVDEKGHKLRKIAINNYKNREEIEGVDDKKPEDKKTLEKKKSRNFSLMSGEASEMNNSSVYDNQYFLK